MIVLGIETSTPQTSVAIGTEQEIVGHVALSGPTRRDVVIQALDHLVRYTGIELEAIGGIAVGLGPGLFTGLRVGVVAGKTLAQVLGVPIVGIPSLDALARARNRIDKDEVVFRRNLAELHRNAARITPHTDSARLAWLAERAAAREALVRRVCAAAGDPQELLGGQGRAHPLGQVRRLGEGGRGGRGDGGREAGQPDRQRRQPGEARAHHPPPGGSGITAPPPGRATAAAAPSGRPPRTRGPPPPRAPGWPRASACRPW